MPLSVDTGHNLALLRGECERLRKHYQTITSDRGDLELKEAKRLAAEGRAAVARTEETWNSKLGAATQAHEDARRVDAERITRYEVRCTANSERISSLERQIAAIKASYSAPLATAVPTAVGSPRFRVPAIIAYVENPLIHYH